MVIALQDRDRLPISFCIMEDIMTLSILGSQLGIKLQETFSHFRRTLFCSKHQRGDEGVGRDADQSSRSQQFLQKFLVPAPGGQMQGSVSLVIDDVRVGSLPQDDGQGILGR